MDYVIRIYSGLHNSEVKSHIQKKLSDYVIRKLITHLKKRLLDYIIRKLILCIEKISGLCNLEANHKKLTDNLKANFELKKNF